MDMQNLGEMEERFAALIWQNVPVGSGRLVELAAAAFGWKKSTTYTVLKRLCARGLFENRGGTVHALVTQEESQLRQGERFLEARFGGSLPLFVAAFTRRGKLKEDEVEELRRLIDSYPGSSGPKGE